jgi:hypothetical protein
VRACVRASERACVHACVCACVRARMRASERACERASERACVHACVHACALIICIISIILNFTYYTHYTHCLQIRQDLGLADHVWQDKRAMIAQSVDKLGDQFRQAMRTGWLSYLSRAYPEHVADGAGPAVGEGILVLPD